MCGTIRPLRVLKPTTRAHSLQPHHIFLYYVMRGRTYKAIRHIRCDSDFVHHRVLFVFPHRSQESLLRSPHSSYDANRQIYPALVFQRVQTEPNPSTSSTTPVYVQISTPPKTKPHMLLLSSTHRLVWDSSHFSHQQHWMWPRQYRQHCTDMWADLTGWYNQKHFDIFNVDDVF